MAAPWADERTDALSTSPATAERFAADTVSSIRDIDELDTDALIAGNVGVPGWITMFSGHRFYPLEPKASDVYIIDIAHALARKCRFTGHTRDFYSVAEHCVRVAEMLPQRWKLRGLLHDGSEYVLPDVAAPIKVLPEFQWFRALEDRVQTAIYERFGLDGDDPPDVKYCDLILCATEKRDLLVPVEGGQYPNKFPPLDEIIVSWSHQEAEARFLAMFHHLYRGA